MAALVSVSIASAAGAGVIVRGGVAKGDPDGGDPWALWDRANLNATGEYDPYAVHAPLHHLQSQHAHERVGGILPHHHLASRKANSSFFDPCTDGHVSG